MAKEETTGTKETTAKTENGETEVEKAETTKKEKTEKKENYGCPMFWWGVKLVWLPSVTIWMGG